MPSTYNGIGTHYYGTRNLQTRVGTCRFCNRQVELRSYDTRLWFVVVYIPIIPLGRKRITDYCPSCSRHFVADLSKWETAKKASISGALQEFHKNPTPENAILAHQQFLGFGHYAEAAEFRKILQSRFSDNAKLQVYLGESLTRLGQTSEAADYFKRALELTPDLPAAAVGVARDAIERSELDKARKTLKFLEQPGAARTYSLEPMETLGNAYQKEGRHADALELYGIILAGLPAVAQHSGFRKRVKKSEKALNKQKSILPKKKFSLRGIFSRAAGGPLVSGWKAALIGGAAVVFLLVMVGVNENTRRNRTLYIINAFDKPATVTIDSVGTVKVGNQPATMVLPEGKWTAHITGPVDQNVELEIHSGYFSRWTASPMWLLNIGGASLLQEEHAHYRAANAEPTDFDFIFGEPFVAFPQMDYPFQDTPETVSLDSNESSKTLTNLIVSPGKPVRIFGYLLENHRDDDALRLAEWDLNLNPDDNQMLYRYEGALYKGDVPEPRLLKFLEDGLSKRPVAIEWHRLYQSLNRHSEADTGNLIAQYDKMLSSEPENSDLLYLRGRLSDDQNQAMDYFNRAIKADPKNAYAYYAIGYNALALGDAKMALPLFSRSVELRGDWALFPEMLTEARLALGDYTSIENDARAELKKFPSDQQVALLLAEALVLQSRTDEADKVVADFESRLAKDGNAEGGRGLQYIFLYVTKKPAELEKIATKDKSPDGRDALCLALVEQGRLDEAEQLQPAEKTAEGSATTEIARGVAWLLKGDAQHASLWLERAAHTLDIEGDADSRLAGKFLLGTTAPSREEVMNLIISTDSKSILAACLALRYPAQASVFAEIAGKFNYQIDPPHNLVERVIAKVRSGQ